MKTLIFLVTMAHLAFTIPTQAAEFKVGYNSARGFSFGGLVLSEKRSTANQNSNNNATAKGGAYELCGFTTAIQNRQSHGCTNIFKE